MKYPMFDHLIDAVLVVGPLKEIYYCNDACVSLFNLPRQKITSGTPIYDLVKVSEPDLFISKNGTKGESKETGYLEVTYESKSGKTGLVQILILPTQELFGRNKLWFIYFHDVSLEERLHAKYVKQIREKEEIIQELKALQEAKGLAPSAAIKSPLIKASLENQYKTIHEVVNELGQGLSSGELGIKNVQTSINTLLQCSKKLKDISSQV